MRMNSYFTSDSRPSRSSGSGTTPRCNISFSRMFRSFSGFSIDWYSFTTVAFEIEREDAVQARGASKNLGVAQRADCVVVTRAPMVLHRQARKLVVLGVTFVVLSPVNQVNDVVDFVTGDRLQDLQIIVLLKVSGKPAQQGIKGTLDPVHVLELAGACSRAA